MRWIFLAGAVFYLFAASLPWSETSNRAAWFRWTVDILLIFVGSLCIIAFCEAS